MRLPSSRRSKVRGWPRRLRQLDAFRKRHLALDEAALAEDGRDWVKLWLNPWARLIPPAPPAWMRRRMLAALADIHAAWHARLLAHEAETGVPFDCMLWWVEGEMPECQVMFAVGDERARYRGAFFEPRPDVPPSPPAHDLAASERLAALTWVPGVDYGTTQQQDLDDDPAWRRHFERRYRSRVFCHEGTGTETTYFWKTGAAWIGRLPGWTPPDPA